jgi:hypothetical protein
MRRGFRFVAAKRNYGMPRAAAGGRIGMRRSGSFRKAITNPL